MNKLVAIVGMSGTGKSVVTDYLEEQNWKKLYFGGITYKLMKEAGIERTEDGKSEKELLSIAYALEIKSEHPLARAITSKAIDQNLQALKQK